MPVPWTTTLCLYQVELETEAGIMAALDSPYIIRLIGLCKSDWMLVLEYAPLGPLKDYLRQHKRSATPHELCDRI